VRNCLPISINCFTGSCILTFVLLIFGFKTSYSQEKIVLNPSFQNLPWNEFVTNAQNTFGINIYYQDGDVEDLTIKFSKNNASLSSVLEKNLEPLGLKISSDGKGNYFVSHQKIDFEQPDPSFFPEPDLTNLIKAPTEKAEAKKESKKYLNTHDDYISRKITIGSRREGNNQTEATITGYVISSENKTPVIQATIHAVETGAFTTTDEDGYFEFTVPRGRHTLSVQSMGMYEKLLIANVLSGGRITIQLDSKAYMLEGAVIRSNVRDNVTGSQMGFQKLTAKTIKEIPLAFGEKDYLKATMLLPGVHAVGEVSSGFNVRGSPADQNLFVISGVPVYNVAHLFGFFSAFSADAVNDFEIYKSNIPIEYGGRLSSIFNINVRKGNTENFSMRGGISPVSGKLLAEGPIKKGKSSYLFAGRSTYSDWILEQIEDENIKNSSASFADGLVNLWFSKDKKNQFNLFAYGSRDISDLSIGAKSRYSNLGASLGWHHRFSEKHSGSAKLAFSNYTFEEENDEIVSLAYLQNFGMTNYSAALDLSLRLNDSHTIGYGIGSELKMIDESRFRPLTEFSDIQPQTLEAERGLESYFYLGDTWNVNEKLEVTAGLRYVFYSYFGPRTVYSYAENSSRSVENITDTTSYGRRDMIANYHNPEYRIAVKYVFSDRMSVKASYNRLHQYIFLLSNNIAVSPTDKWKLVDNHIKPMSGNQYSVGLYRNFYGNILEASVEAYYKKVNHLVEYKDGADFLFNRIPETDIIQGDLDAWGIEFMIRKTFGDFTGWINYTYSRSMVLAVDASTGDMNNLGRSYPANYDKPHAANLVMNYRISKRISFSSNVVYSTGRPITYPTSIFYQNGIEITDFSYRNEFRLPDYFRVDVSLNIEGNLKKNKLAHGSWSFSVYNLTARKNAYSVYFRNEDGKIQGYKLSIFGTMIPSVTYNLKLGNYED